MNVRTILSRTTILWSLVAILIIAGVVTMAYAFNGGQSNAAEEIDLVYTNAASTLAAQQLTLQAGVPSATLSVGSPTTTFTPLASPTLGTPPTAFPTSTLSVGSAPKCDNAIYLADVTIPDGTTIAPGIAFTKTWRVSNTGTCTWTATYKIVFVTGDAMSGQSIAIGKIVKPGESAEISVALTAPTTVSNSLTGTWKLTNDASVQFGNSLTVVIKVGTVTGTAGTNTNTPTPTPTGVIVIQTSTYTSTPIPTNTFTPTPTPTPTEETSGG